ncbi:hypothetical protein ABZP36_013214 [Zizania latifolia]
MAEASKVPSPATEIPKRQEVQCEKPLRNAQEVPNYPEIQDPHTGNLVENVKINTLVPDLQHEPDATSHLVATEENVAEPASASPSVETMPLQDIHNEENALVNDMELRSKEEPLSNESLKSSKRRSSLSTKPEYPENGSKTSPAVPSYMAATQSAKAKLRGQNSPRLSSDTVEKNGFTRRHSLPSTNDKLNSHSPRAQRPTHAGGKEGVKADKSMLLSRDASGMAILPTLFGKRWVMFEICGYSEFTIPASAFAKLVQAKGYGSDNIGYGSRLQGMHLDAQY